ncbi:hypothetical protein BSAF29S_03389 [Bacillus safensis subsp. safensis]
MKQRRNNYRISAKRFRRLMALQSRGLNILERILPVELTGQEEVIEYTWEELLQEGVVSAQTTE